MADPETQERQVAQQAARTSQQLWAPANSMAISVVPVVPVVSPILPNALRNTGWNEVYASPTPMPALRLQPSVWASGLDPRNGGGTHYFYSIVPASPVTTPVTPPATMPPAQLTNNGVAIRVSRNPTPAHSRPPEPPESVVPNTNGRVDTPPNKNRLTKRKATPQKRNFEISNADIIWNANYERLLTYKSKHGDCLVPQDFRNECGDSGRADHGVPLGKWVGTQRTAKKNDRLSPYRTRKLEEVDFVWSTVKTWDQMFDRLVDYLGEHGNCDVPHDYAEDPKLSSWIRSQRKKKKHVLTSQQKLRLESIGFKWGIVQKEAWDDMYERLAKYRDENGDCLVSFRYEPDRKLGGWVHNQRSLRKLGNLSDECQQRLDDLGFTWRASHKFTWDEMFGRLVKYRATHGDCTVPSRNLSDPRLGTWVSAQRCKRRRSRKKDGVLTPLQVDRLDGIGFVWEVKDGAWDVLFVRLVDFKRKNGHCSVPWHYKPDPQLGNWVMKQRLEPSVLSHEQVDKLESVGFSFQ